MWLPLGIVGVFLVSAAIFGFYDKAKYRAAHPEEFPNHKR